MKVKTIMSSTFTIQAADYPIKSVTVFKSSKAEIVRTFTVSLQKGHNKVEIRGLPNAIDKHSVRVSGLGEARLSDVVFTIGSLASGVGKSATFGASEVIRALNARRESLESEKRLREQEADLLLKYAQTLKGDHVNPTQMCLFLESFVDQSRNNFKARVELSGKIQEIDYQIEVESDKITAKRGFTLSQVNMVIFADENIPIDLKLIYIVSDAHWTPTYELHATTENGKPSSSVSLHYGARVTQSSGEDWNNTTLKLSTIVSDIIVDRIPHLQILRLHPPQETGNSLEKTSSFGDSHNEGPSSQRNRMFGEPANPPPNFNFGGVAQTQAPQKQGFSFGTAAPAPIEIVVNPRDRQQYEARQQHIADMTAAIIASLPDENGCEEINEPDVSTEPTTIVSESPTLTAFSACGESTILSNGVGHQVCIAILPLEAKISYVTTPRIDTRVFLQYEVENTSGYRLLQGPVTIILNDHFLSNTSINDVDTGDKFECILGDDSSIKVTYSCSLTSFKTIGKTFSEVTNTMISTTKISIHNKHQFAISNLVVREVVPTCDASDNSARAVLRKPAKLAHAMDGEIVEDINYKGLFVGWGKLVDGKGGAKEGKFEWRWNIGNGEKVNLEAEWKARVPGEIPWVEEWL